MKKHTPRYTVKFSADDNQPNKKYNTGHWLLPVSKRVYIIVDSTGKIIFRKDTGFSLPENQTSTLISEIDRNIR